MHDYARALSGECSADGLTYATSTAGDEHNLAMQPSFHAGREVFRYFMFSDKPMNQTVSNDSGRNIVESVGDSESDREEEIIMASTI